MFDIVTTSVCFIWTTVYYGLYLSYKTGQFLVAIIGVLLENVFIIINNFLELLVIFLEAFTIFFQDVVQCAQQLCRSVSYLMEVTIGGISTMLCDINNIVTNLITTVIAGYNFVLNCILNVGTVIGQTFIFIKRLVVLFGSGVWFSVTFIPLLVVYLGTLCTYYLGQLLEEIKDSICTGVLVMGNMSKHFYEFITDVPAESIAGIAIAICLAYVVVQFHIILYSYMYNQFKNACRYIQHRFRRRRTFPQAMPRVRTSPRRRPQIREDLNSSRLSKMEHPVDERYCVICQERIKCILVLPCRHVCMCNECSVRLQLYNNTCPICRNDIESTMKIFV